MRKTIQNLTILLLILSSSTAFSQTNKNSKLLKEIFDYEFEKVEKLYKDCMENPCYGDSTFYTAWYTGLKAEQDDNPQQAIQNYLVALNFTRFELSTYEIKLSLGRAEIVQGNIDKGTKHLLEFIAEAKADINDEESMWGLTEEGKKELNDKISFATRLIEEY